MTGQIRRLILDRRGFTLTELMVVLGISMIISMAGYSGFTGFQKKEYLRSAASRLSGNMREARMLAMEQGVSHTVVFTGSTYTVFVDTNEDFIPDADERIIHQVDVADHDPSITLRMVGDLPMRFDARGIPKCATGGIRTAAIVFQNDQAFYRMVMISALGRIKIEPTE